MGEYTPPEENYEDWARYITWLWVAVGFVLCFERPAFLDVFYKNIYILTFIVNDAFRIPAVCILTRPQVQEIQKDHPAVLRLGGHIFDCFGLNMAL